MFLKRRMKRHLKKYHYFLLPTSSFLLWLLTVNGQ